MLSILQTLSHLQPHYSNFTKEKNKGSKDHKPLSGRAQNLKLK